MQSGQGDGVQELVGRAGGRAVHGRARLGQEVLDDHLLHVAVAGVAGGDGLEGLDPVGPVLADADQDPGREGDGQLAGGLEGGQPPRRASCPGRPGGRPGPRAGSRSSSPGWRSPAAAAPAPQEKGRRRWRGAAARSRRAPGGTWPPGSRWSSRNRGSSSQSPGHRVALLGSLAQGEQRLVAAGLGALPGDVQHLLGRQVGGVEPGRGLGERAVAALVPAQHRQGDEHLRRVRDPGAVGSVSHGAGLAEKLVGSQLEELVPAQSIGSSHMTLHATWRGGGSGQSASAAAEVTRSGRSRTTSSPGTPLRAP